jgi:hypothetical protein
MILNMGQGKYLRKDSYSVGKRAPESQPHRELTACTAKPGYSELWHMGLSSLTQVRIQALELLAFVPSQNQLPYLLSLNVNLPISKEEEGLI